MSNITLDSVVKRNDTRVVTTELEDELVMMDTESGNYLKLNRTGHDIWRSVSKPVVVKDLIKNLIEKYEVPEAQCVSDLVLYLNAMERQGILIKQQ